MNAALGDQPPGRRLLPLRRLVGVSPRDNADHFNIAVSPNGIRKGWLVDALSWRAIFFINLPIALLTLGLALWRGCRRAAMPRDEGTVDWIGGILATLGLAGLAYSVTAASR